MMLSFWAPMTSKWPNIHTIQNIGAIILIFSEFELDMGREVHVNFGNS